MPTVAVYLVLSYLNYGGSMIAIPMNDLQHCMAAETAFKDKSNAQCIATGFPEMKEK